MGKRRDKDLGARVYIPLSLYGIEHETKGVHITRTRASRDSRYPLISITVVVNRHIIYT